MKRLFFIFTIIFLAVSTFAETRTFYFARHGQRGDPKYQRHFENCDEDALTPKGIEQAEFLGAWLNSLGFTGTIYVSPYYRTLQTATYAASKMKPAKMILEPRIQEITGVKDNSGIVRTTKKCITKKEIHKNFPNVIIPKKMKFPWRYENERQSQTDERLGQVIDECLENSEGDIFFVCHGGLLPGVIREMAKRGADFERRKACNCCLYAFTFDTDTKKVIDAKDYTANYLSGEYITDNMSIMTLSN